MIGTLQKSQRFFGNIIAHLILGFGLNYNTKKPHKNKTKKKKLSIYLCIASCLLL